MNKSKAEVYYHLNYWDWIHNHVNVHEDWDLTWKDVKRYEHKQIF